MNKLSFEDLKNLAETVATNDLLEQVSGGTFNDCHDGFSGTSGTSGADDWRAPVAGVAATPCDNI